VLASGSRGSGTLLVSTKKWYRRTVAVMKRVVSTALLVAGTALGCSHRPPMLAVIDDPEPGVQIVMSVSRITYASRLVLHLPMPTTGASSNVWRPRSDEGRRTTVELIDVGGRKLAYHRAGGGQPLVLLHGAWSDGREWRPQLASAIHGDLELSVSK
jgi:hypothetical protein